MSVMRTTRSLANLLDNGSAVLERLQNHSAEDDDSLVLLKMAEHNVVAQGLPILRLANKEESIPAPGT